MSNPRILAFAGSTRKESFNKKLASLASSLARKHDTEVTLIDLAEYPMPLYDGDLEASEGVPAKAEELYELFKSHDALLISSPEYNSSISPLLKNTIDWISRPRKDEMPMAAYQGKVAGLMSASPGQLGGMRGLVHVRAILGNIGVLVVPDQVAISQAHQAFAEDGSLTDEKSQARLEKMITAFIKTVRGQLSN